MTFPGFAKLADSNNWPFSTGPVLLTVNFFVWRKDFLQLFVHYQRFPFWLRPWAALGFFGTIHDRRLLNVCRRVEPKQMSGSCQLIGYLSLVGSPARFAFACSLWGYHLPAADLAFHAGYLTRSAQRL